MVETDASGIMRSDSSMNSSSEMRWKLRFWSVFVGQSLSLLGSALTQFVLLWWVTDTTGSMSALGTAGMAALLPQAILGPLGGVYADRHNRQLILILTDMVSAGCMIVLIALFQTGCVELWHLYVMMAIRSAMQAFQVPAAAASTAMLVPHYFISTAAGLAQSMQGVITIGAAPLGALAISAMPIGWALGIDVLTAILGIVPLLLCTIPQHDTQEARRNGIWVQFRHGIGAVWHDFPLRSLYGLMTGTVLVIMPLFTLVPLLVKEHFGGGAPAVALIESVAGVGMIVGGAVLAALSPRKKVPWILFGFAGTCAGISVAAGMPGDMFWMAVVVWGFSAMGTIMGNAAVMALIQSTVPNELQGRVISILTTLMGLASPLGLIIVTCLGKWEILETRWLFVVFGAVGAVIQLMGFVSSAIRGMDTRKSMS